MDAQALEAAINAKGSTIRELKSKKEDVKAHVAELLKLKAEYKALTGHDFGAAPSGATDASAAPPAAPKQLTKKELRILEKQKQAVGI